MKISQSNLNQDYITDENQRKQQFKNNTTQEFAGEKGSNNTYFNESEG
jgi:hypothetical protein